MHEIKADKFYYFLAHNDNDVFHYGCVPETHEVATGQPHLETFLTKQNLLNRLTTLNLEITESCQQYIDELEQYEILCKSQPSQLYNLGII